MSIPVYVTLMLPQSQQAHGDRLESLQNYQIKFHAINRVSKCVSKSSYALLHLDFIIYENLEV